MFLNEYVDIAMSIDWWITQRDTKPVRDAIVGAFLQHWLPVIENALKKNKREGRTPYTWDQLAGALDRNFASIWRTKKGKVKLSWYDAELLAEIFDLRIEQLTPTRSQWLPVATRLLCRDDVCLPDAKAYAFYRMSGVGAPQNQLDTQVLSNIRQRLHDDFPDELAVNDAIVQTAQQVGGVLLDLPPHGRNA